MDEVIRLLDPAVRPARRAAAAAEDVIWIEVLARDGEVVTRHRAIGPEIHIGRGYRNEVVLDDPHIAPDHLRIFRNAEGDLVIEDLGSLNGLYHNGHAVRVERIVANGTDRFRIGRTELRVRDGSHPVAPEKLDEAEKRRWPLAILLAALILGIEALSVWLSEVREVKLSDFLPPIVVVTTEAGIWIAGWSLLSRLFSRSARVERMVLIAFSLMLGYSVFDEIASLGAFAYSLPWLSTYRFVVYWILVGVAAFLSLRTIGRGHKRLKIAAAASIPLVAIGYQLINQSDFRASYDHPQLVHRLYPPEFRGVRVKTEGEFLTDAGALKAGLDAAREEDVH